MGAPAGSWMKRALLLLGIGAGVAVVLWSPALGSWERLVLLAAAALLGGVIAFREIPAFDPLGRVHWRLGRRPERTCALTFDDGPSAGTRRVVEILGRYQVKATFFVLAANARRHPDVLRLVAEQGHTVAIHGVTHRKVHRDDQATVARELSTAAAELSALGVPPARLYRPPHGLKSTAALRAARAAGCQVWAWTRGIWDTDGPAPEVLVNRATRFARAGMVLLLHDGRGDEVSPNIEPMVSALPRLLERLRDDGFTFLTLDRA